MPQNTPRVRPATPADAPGLCAVLNAIIAAGGTTAIETPLDVDDFIAAFLRAPGQISCVTAHGADGGPMGFQHLSRHPKLPEDIGDIATFVRVGAQGTGVGRAMFVETQRGAQAAGLTAINATIRADNVGGLAYYTRMGFQPHTVQQAVPLADGTPVDRVSKRLMLA